MNLKIDLRSALVGLVMGIGVMLALGAGESSGSPVGRYQVAGAGVHFMLTDTVTGQTWCANIATPPIAGVAPGFFERKLGR